MWFRILKIRDLAKEESVLGFVNLIGDEGGY